ncbi:hypothetical protein LA080_003153 [Diaporthe eres]|uniref:DUF7689 domain-containing protein n=1 Tax=Diaporthe vaccinii TaxID=105482 RepID=A0ABR4DXC1_9PEZI|nr:hypothetical protein LA080_003153 [Diaporthe eres]
MANPELAFQAWMRERFSNVGINAGKMGYTIPPDSRQDRSFNCIAHAIGKKDVRLTPQNKHQLDEVYKLHGYFEEPNLSGNPEVGDAEVYAKPTARGIPLHAHRVVKVDPNMVICSSKMGDDFLIRHPRALLECLRPNSNQYEYGVVQYRYRFNETKFLKAKSEEVRTKSGRLIKRSQASFTKTGSHILKTDAARSKSNRVIKKPKVAKK